MSALGHALDLRPLRRAWLWPLIFFQCYLGVIGVLFFIGPWPWPIDNGWSVAAYLAAAQVCIAIGYLTSWRPVERRAYALSEEIRHATLLDGVRFLKISIVISLALAIPTSLARTGSPLPNVLFGVTNLGHAYNEAFLLTQAGNPFVVAEYLRILTSPALIAALPLTIAYWSYVSLPWRCAGVTAIAMSLAIYLATGVNKGVGDLLITAPWIYYLATKAAGKKVNVRLWLLALILGVSFFVFLQFFTTGQRLREGMVGEMGVINPGSSLIWADTRNLQNILNINQRIAYESLTRYLTSGYYALSLSFHIDSPSTYGLGNSMFLARNADALLGTTYFTKQSIPALIELQFGWKQFQLWHSIYPWLASDVGFVGALFLIGVFANLLGRSWGNSLLTLDHRWVTMLYLMLILFFYVSGNNQVFQSGETCVGFFMVLMMLLSQARRRRQTPDWNSQRRLLGNT